MRASSKLNRNEIPIMSNAYKGNSAPEARSALSMDDMRVKNIAGNVIFIRSLLMDANTFLSHFANFLRINPIPARMRI
nr:MULTISPECIES: hypothetical protein [unclassified Oceanispirochaeta]